MERQFSLLLDINWNYVITCIFMYICNTKYTVVSIQHLGILIKAKGMFGEDSNHLLPTMYEIK